MYNYIGNSWGFWSQSHWITTPQIWIFHHHCYLTGIIIIYVNHFYLHVTDRVPLHSRNFKIITDMWHVIASSLVWLSTADNQESTSICFWKKQSWLLFNFYWSLLQLLLYHLYLVRASFGDTLSCEGGDPYEALLHHRTDTRLRTFHTLKHDSRLNFCSSWCGACSRDRCMVEVGSCVCVDAWGGVDNVQCSYHKSAQCTGILCFQSPH